MKFGQKPINGYGDLEAQRCQQQELQKLGFDERNRAVLASMQRHGDIPAVIRDVRHIVAFGSNAKLEPFKKAVAQLGFDFGRTSEDKLENGQMTWTLFFTAKHAMDLGSVTRYSQTMRSNAHTYGGVYLGWETQPVTMKDRKPWPKA